MQGAQSTKVSYIKIWSALHENEFHPVTFMGTPEKIAIPVVGVARIVAKSPFSAPKKL